MKPRPLPKSIERKVWEKWPTMDELRLARPDMKQYKLRSLLRDVTCYRCPDQTARYVQAEIDQLIEEEEDFEEATKPKTDDEGRPVPQLYDSMVLFRESMRAMGELLKGMGEMRQMIGDISKAATEPIQLGMSLVKENVELMRSRLQHYEQHHDTSLMVYENMLSLQNERNLQVKRAEGAEKVKNQAAGLAMAYLPQLLNDLRASVVGKGSNPRADAALNAISSLEPDVLDAIVESKTNTPEQAAAWRRVRDLIKQSQESQANQQSQSHAA